MNSITKNCGRRTKAAVREESLSIMKPVKNGHPAGDFHNQEPVPVSRKRRWRLLGYLGLLLLQLPASAAGADDFAADRARMVKVIEQSVRETRFFIDKQALDPGVMAAMGRVARHRFVPEDLRKYAYDNRPLPIGYGQTISQPYIVALMTDLMNVDDDDQVLEVGTGSGYQAAILAELVDRVYTMEIIEPLGKKAEKSLQDLKVKNVEVRIGDGYYGWPEKGPFDAIVVTAAASHIPPPLVSQLKRGGRMVIPVGSPFMVQQLVMVEKEENGQIRTRQILPVRFVTLTGSH
jgi:protein-L-isoaspartate(D-aspartate) O-methyltransferase